MKEVKKRPPKIEFYSALPEIRSMYEAGVVFGTAIYNELSTTGKITMSYRQFATYFKKEIVDKLQNSTPKKEVATAPVETPVDVQVTTEQNNLSQTEGEHEPVWGVVGGKKGKSYNPHTRPIDPDDVISIGKK